MCALSGRAAEAEDNRGPVIVISGAPGSGKSTYAKRLAKDLGLSYFTSGMIFRETAKSLGLSLEELGSRAEKDPSIDLMIDMKVLETARKGGVVIDSHLAAWVLSGIADVSILVKAHPVVRIMRISEREGRGLEQVALETLEREESQLVRFYEYYGYDLLDASHFDLVIDTGILGPDEVYAIIKSFTVSKLRRLGLLPGGGPANL